MAQTKRKRQTKHRGNAAGVVETRGRPGSKLDADARKQRANPAKKGQAKTREQLRQDRLDRPPSWRSAINRGALAAGFFFLALVVLFKQPFVESLGVGVFVLVFYVLLGYGMDSVIYRRRMTKKARPR